MCPAKCTDVLPWATILTVETVVIILGNSATVIVFWKQRSQLKRTRYLLINLSVADLMVGVANVESVANQFWKLKSSNCSKSWTEYVVLEEFFGSASVLFLVLISLERLYAVVLPFPLRAAAIRTYICSIIVAWLLSEIVPSLQLLRALKVITPRTFG